MSTKCLIGLETAIGGAVRAIYCQHDGYIHGGVGETLAIHYGDANKVAALISGGNISALGELLSPEPRKTDERRSGFSHIHTFFYARDGGEDTEENEAREYADMAAFAEYAKHHDFLYCCRYGEWLVYNEESKEWERLFDHVDMKIGPDISAEVEIKSDGGRWVEGVVTADNGHEGAFYAKVYDEPSENGLDGDGRVSKLSVRVGGKEVINFDRGFDVFIETAEFRAMYEAIKERFN